VSMGPRLHVNGIGLHLEGQSFALDEGASRHVQVLRLQPGDGLRLFDGRGHEWSASVVEIGRKLVQVRVGGLLCNARELPVQVTLAVGMPANDRMDGVVEKATELGAYAIQPLQCARSVLRLDGERAAKKVVHWQAVAVAASEQCGRAWVPLIHPVLSLPSWLKQDAALPVAANRGLLSLRDAVAVPTWVAASKQTGEAQSEGVPAAPHHGANVHAVLRPSAISSWCFLNGPEGGLTLEEEALALQQGWTALSLGKRVLRADTAPLAVLSVMAALFET
jgi:16S rRNA (uracil1498-N3)-methyltransferase